MYIDKIEIWPEEKRASVVYAIREGQKWPTGKSKYEILLLKILSYDIKQWTFGTYKTIEQSVLVEWWLVCKPAIILRKKKE